MRRAAFLLTLAALLPAGAAASTTGAATITYHFARPPIVPLERDSAGHPAFDVYAKLDHALPRARSGGLSASLVLIDAGEGDSVSTVGRAGHCYASGIDTSFSASRILEHPHIGDLVRVRLLIGTHHVAATTHVRLSKPLRPHGENQDAPYVTALGC